MKRALIFVHRWLGVVVSGLFVIWFASAIGMMYWDFPGVTAADRLAHAASLDGSQVLLSPQAAYATAAPSASDSTDTHILLNTFNGRPVYRLRTGRREIVIFADTGERRGDISPDAMRQLASAWTNRSPAAAQVEQLRDVDQWTVQGQFRDLQPLWKYSWPDGQQVYVSEVTGEVVQYTTTRSRLHAYLGPIPHWLYFTPLRKHPAQWSAFVIWSSGVAMVAALFGLILGGWSYSPSKRYRVAGIPTSVPYREYKRWHMLLGLMFGVGAISWAFSGMLSMEPFPGPAPDGASSSGRIAQTLRGEFRLAAFAGKHPAEAIRQLGTASIKELELTAFAGDAAYLARLSNGHTRIVPVDGKPLVEFDRQRLIDVLQNAANARGGADIRVLTEYDRYYLDRRGERPLPVIVAAIHDAQRTRFYIDPKTARIVGAYSGDWMNRWLYHGLHSLDFPWLYKRRPLWDIVVITFMLGGLALSVTSVMLAWRVLRRKRENHSSLITHH
jgi:hypothetical protein